MALSIKIEVQSSSGSVETVSGGFVSRQTPDASSGRFYCGNSRFGGAHSRSSFLTARYFTLRLSNDGSIACWLDHDLATNGQPTTAPSATSITSITGVPTSIAVAKRAGWAEGGAIVMNPAVVVVTSGKRRSRWVLCSASDCKDGHLGACTESKTIFEPISGASGHCPPLYQATGSASSGRTCVRCDDDYCADCAWYISPNAQQ